MERAFTPEQVEAKRAARRAASGRKGGLQKAANGYVPVTKKVVTAQWNPKEGLAPKLLDILEEYTDDDGQVVQVTRGDKIVEYVRCNATLESAAAAAGVSRLSFRDWLREAAEARQKVVARRALTPKEIAKSTNLSGAKNLRITRRERALIEFVDRMEQAMAEAELALAAAATRLAEGGWDEGFVSEKQERIEGELTTVSKTVRKSVAAPNVAALQLVLSRRHASGWAPSERELAATGGGRGGVSPAQLSAVLDGLADKIARRQAAMEAIEASSSETTDIVDAEVVEESEPAATDG